MVEELLELRRRNLRLASEVVQDLKDLEEFGLALPEKRLHKVKGTPLWELRSMWQHSIARTLFFGADGRLLIVTHIFQKRSGQIPKTALQRGLERMNRWKGRTTGETERIHRQARDDGPGMEGGLRGGGRHA